MAMTCNIDARGRVARLIFGILVLVVGVALCWFWARGSGSAVRWTVAIACLVGGAFPIYEARAGWCIMRAMGFKTPM